MRFSSTISFNKECPWLWLNKNSRKSMGNSCKVNLKKDLLDKFSSLVKKLKISRMIWKGTKWCDGFLFLSKFYSVNLPNTTCSLTLFFQQPSMDADSQLSEQFQEQSCSAAYSWYLLNIFMYFLDICFNRIPIANCPPIIFQNSLISVI